MEVRISLIPTGGKQQFLLMNPSSLHTDDDDDIEEDDEECEAQLKLLLEEFEDIFRLGTSSVIDLQIGRAHV